MNVDKRMRKDADGAQHKDVVEIDPRGDLVLQVGTKPSRLLRMSSNLLMRVSDVFQAMLEGKFVEASIKHDASNPLKLPDDDAHTMELMCNLLMHQIADARDINAIDLPDLAASCDKYQCLTSLRIWFQMRLSQFVLDTTGPTFRNKKGVKIGVYKQDGLEYLDALAIAYLIDDGPNFEALSHQVMMRYTHNTIIQDMHAALLDIMPTEFRTGLAAEWTKVSERLMASMYEPVDFVIEDEESSEDDGGCRAQHERLGAYLCQLKAAEVLPPFHVAPNKNILEILETRFQSDTAFTYISAVKNCKRKCLRCEQELGVHIDQAVEDLRRECGYLCLKCVKTGNFTTSRESCTIHGK